MLETLLRVVGCYDRPRESACRHMDIPTADKTERIVDGILLDCLVPLVAKGEVNSPMAWSRCTKFVSLLEADLQLEMPDGLASVLCQALEVTWRAFFCRMGGGVAFILDVQV